MADVNGQLCKRIEWSVAAARAVFWLSKLSCWKEGGRLGRCVNHYFGSLNKLEVKLKQKKLIRRNNAFMIFFFPQSCSVRDPNTGFLFNLQPLASGKGYMATGIGKKFLVRILTVQSLAYGCSCCIFPVLLSEQAELWLSPLMKLELSGKYCAWGEGRNGR